MNVKLKGKRVEKGYTQQELAKLIGMNTCSYNHKENGSIDFTLSEIQDLMYYLDCDFDDIFFRKKVTNKYENETK
jgi:DNA-binding XRE family transcriptional regulator